MKQSTMAAWIVLTLFSFVPFTINAQNNEPQVEQKGNVFVQKSTRSSGQIIKTNYIYEDSKGNRDTIYLSSTGKAFVFKVSKNGNTYKKYLPEVTKKLNSQAYDEKTKTSQKFPGR